MTCPTMFGWQKSAQKAGSLSDKTGNFTFVKSRRQLSNSIQLAVFTYQDQAVPNGKRIVGSFEPTSASWKLLTLKNHLSYSI